MGGGREKQLEKKALQTQPRSYITQMSNPHETDILGSPATPLVNLKCCLDLSKKARNSHECGFKQEPNNE